MENPETDAYTHVLFLLDRYAIGSQVEKVQWTLQ